jgi:hypothetical protein
VLGVLFVSVGSRLGGRSGPVAPVRGFRVLVPWGFGDVSERGSVCRHNDVRESRSQFWDAQKVAPE